MGAISDIKDQVKRLSQAEQDELLAWLLERDHERWDAQIATDSRTGKLDALIAEAKADRAAGKARKL